MNLPDSEEIAWATVPADDLWVMDKLILGRKMGYVCGPVGMDVPKAGYYCLRPPVNAMGYGFKTKKLWIRKTTDHLEPGMFWTEWFEGRHISVDYSYGKQLFAAEGVRSDHNYQFTEWKQWFKVDDQIPVPQQLRGIAARYRRFNIEYIGEKVIEAHFRSNQDFQWGNKSFYPYFKNPMPQIREEFEDRGYEWVDYPGDNGRIGAFIR